MPDTPGNREIVLMSVQALLRRIGSPGSINEACPLCDIDRQGLADAWVEGGRAAFVDTETDKVVCFDCASRHEETLYAVFAKFGALIKQRPNCACGAESVRFLFDRFTCGRCGEIYAAALTQKIAEGEQPPDGVAFMCAPTCECGTVLSCRRCTTGLKIKRDAENEKT